MVRVLLLLGLMPLVFSQSWQGYVDEQLIGSGLKDAAILNSDGSVSASSDGFSLYPGEEAALVALLNNPTEVFAKGITVHGIKYLGIKGDPGSIYGKKGAGGIIVVQTANTIIIGVYNESLQPGNAALHVEKFGDYLKDIGY